ncbi:PhnD/SsuA/transferrin family substrate-binding protein [Mesorhizobium sp. Z1-4]|uniref:phosphate/phosphite/phosphonate ABC transporter substrate-binding protein n=1 Tax=Mesorhizobium sp. Z1-4 TaxID=2448478 RepID=UPI000FDC4A45|nr:PhnD/SsuA/transferrin family substrate-binding protein [Mesorhizobium sp. Z1-4]
MNEFAALTMYDWPEVRADTDAQWAAIRDALNAAGVDAPDRLTRHNAELPAVPGGIRDASGAVVSPDPASLPPDDLDAHAMWRHPALLFAQTCWGPMEHGLRDDVQLIGQPDYSDCEGGKGAFYSSAILARRGSVDVAAPADGAASLPLEAMRGARFAFNGPDSMSGIIALTRDLETAGENLSVFSERLQTGAHRASIAAVASGEADICTIDCRSWQLARRFDDNASKVSVIGWTARRRGLPYICARTVPQATVAAMRSALRSAGIIVDG